MPDPDQIPYVSTIKRLTNIDEIRDVPVLGGLYGTANTVIDYFESNCNPDWNIYVQTLFPPLGQVVLVLLTFGLDDVLRGYLRPAGGRGFGGLGRASRRRRRPTKAQRALGKLEGGIPEIGEELGKHLPGAEVIKARPIGTAEELLWKVDGLAQRGLWYWMIADILDDFTVNWTTALYRSEDCRDVDAAGMERFEGIQAVPQESIFTTVPLGTVVQSWGNLSHDHSGLTVPAGMTGLISYSARLEPGNQPGSVLELSLRITGNGTSYIQNALPGTNPETGEPQWIATAHVPPGARVDWGGRNNGSTATRYDATVMAMFRGAPTN